MRRRSPVSSPNGGSNGTNNLRSTSPATYTTGKATTTTTTSTNGIHKARHSSGSPSTTTWLPLLPAMAASFLFFSCLLLDVSYHHFVVPIYQSYQRIPLAQDYNFHENLRNEFTYYDRHCSKDDLTTRDSNDLRITPDMNGEQASRVMLKHGAAAIPNILTKETAAYLHKYLANKHAEPLHYNEVFWQEMHRLSLALGTKDHPSVAQALEEVGNNELVKTTLEGILGPDPALVEISTLTARSGCPPQGIHTDSDWFGSSLLYGRSFLHSYSMFIALQDTTEDLGATTVCPGSHMCADVDLEEVCMNHGAFSVSTNGKTGREEGMLFAGDGFLFNQNVWHRGPQNNMDKDRIMFILTFTSSKQQQESKEHDLRRQGLGTYYYQRWNMWGHTLSDLKQATKRMIQPWAGLRALGLLPSKGGIPWIHHFAQQVGPGADFYDDYELGNMKEQLLSDQPSFLFSKSEEWKPFLSETFHLWTLLSGIVYAVVCIGSLVLFPRSKRSALMWNAILLGLFGIIYLYMTQTELGRSVTSRHIHHRPMTPYHPDMANEGSHRTTFPERNDVLFGTRMDSDFLTSFRHFLEYHPGNQDFLSRVAEAATASDASDTAVAQEIVESMIQESEMGLYRRFLYQNHTNGAWELLSMPEAVEQTRRKVLLERDSTKQEEVKDLQHKLSVHRFGLHRESPVSMQAAQETEAALDKVMACRDGAACPNVAMEAPDTDAMGEEPALDSIPNEGDKIWAWDEYEGVWAEAVFLGPKVGDEGEEMYEFYFFSDTTQVKPTHYVRPYYRVRSGDRVIVDYEGHGREFFHGTVKFVYPDGYCHIAFDDGELHHFMPRARVFLPPRGPPMEDGGSEGEVMQE